MTGKIFVDTNLWIYLHSKDPKQEDYSETC